MSIVLTMIPRRQRTEITCASWISMGGLASPLRLMLMGSNLSRSSYNIKSPVTHRWSSNGGLDGSMSAAKGWT
jgi:hypothetical protein